MTTQKRQTSIYLPEDIREKIQAIATEDQRSFTFVVEMLLKEALQAREDIEQNS